LGLFFLGRMKYQSFQLIDQLTTFVVLLTVLRAYEREIDAHPRAKVVHWLIRPLMLLQLLLLRLWAVIDIPIHAIAALAILPLYTYKHSTGQHDTTQHNTTKDKKSIRIDRPTD
jgi:hypothetical protein